MTKGKYTNKMIVLLCTVAYFVSYFSRKTFSVMMVEMTTNAQVIDRDIASLVAGALFVTYGVGQLVSGYLGDRISPKYLMFAGICVSALCNLLVPLVNQYVMIAVWAVNGFAQALLWPPIVRILAENLSREKYVTANLIVTVGAHVSTILLYLYAPICIKFMSWKAVYFSSAIVSFAVGIVFIISMCIVLKDREQDKKERTTLKEKVGLGHIFSSSGVLPIFIAIIAMGFMRDGIESWLPTLYCEAFNKSSEESILLSVFIPIFSIVSLFIVRIIHKHKLFNNEASGAGILFSLSSILCIFVTMLISLDHMVARIICLILLAFASACMHSVNFLLISCLPGRFAHTGRSATIGGACNACTYVGAAGSMYGIEMVSRHFGWQATTGVWIGVCLLGALSAVLALKKYTSFMKKN